MGDPALKLLVPVELVAVGELGAVRCPQPCDGRAARGGLVAVAVLALLSVRRCPIAARLARLHARIANVRADALHKATTMLAEHYETIVAEDLNVAGMTRNRRLARAIGDQGFGALRRMLGTRQLGTAGRSSPPTGSTPPVRSARAAVR